MNAPPPPSATPAGNPTCCCRPKSIGWKMKFLWVVSAICSVLGGITIFGGLAEVESAPQEAVVIALGIACAVIPYCFVRAFSEMGR